VEEGRAIERDGKGWPRTLWELTGSAPGFDLGSRDAAHERGDVLAARRLTGLSGRRRIL
jgi:hypothetical protein